MSFGLENELQRGESSTIEVEAKKSFYFVERVVDLLANIGA